MNYRDFNDNEILSYVAENNEDAIELIYEKYKPLINKISSKFYKKYCKNTSLDINDLIQEGMLGLNSAMNHYRENKDTLFYTYAKTCIERKIISAVIAANRQKHQILNESLSFEINLNDSDITLNAFIKDTDNNPENIIVDRERENELMKKLENSLTDFELQILQLKMDGFDYKEIASILDKKVKSVDNALQRIKNKIKKILSEQKN